MLAQYQSKFGNSRPVFLTDRQVSWCQGMEKWLIGMPQKFKMATNNLAQSSIQLCTWWCLRLWCDIHLRGKTLGGDSLNTSTRSTTIYSVLQLLEITFRGYACIGLGVHQLLLYRVIHTRRKEMTVNKNVPFSVDLNGRDTQSKFSLGLLMVLYVNLFTIAVCCVIKLRSFFVFLPIIPDQGNC